MSFSVNRDEATGNCQPGGLPQACMPLQVQWPDLAGPGFLLPMPMPGPPGGVCEDACEFAPCWAGGCAPLSTLCEEPCQPAPCGAGGCASAAQQAASVHPGACEANPMVLYGDFHKQDLGGEIHDMHIEKDLMQAERHKLAEIEKNTMKSWGHLEETLQSYTTDPLGHDHSLVLMVMTHKSTEHCMKTFKDMRLRNPMQHEARDNRLFRVIKTHATKHQWDKKYEIADVLYYDLRDEFVHKKAQAGAIDENMEKRMRSKIKQNGLEYARELQKHGAEWVLIQSTYFGTLPMMKQLYETECTQAYFDDSYYTLCRLYEEPTDWPESQENFRKQAEYIPSRAEYIPSKAAEPGQSKFFDSADSQKKLLQTLFHGFHSKYKTSYGYDMLDVRDFVLKHPDWRAGYHDLMCANVHYGQYKLLERSIFLILFAAYKYKKQQYEASGEDLSMDDVLKRLTCVYLGGGTPTPGKKDQHFPLLLKLIPHFLLVSYDVHKPDIGGAFDRKHRFSPEYEPPDAQNGGDSAPDDTQRLLLIQKMCDYSEVEKIRNTMNATSKPTTNKETGKTTEKRFYVVIQDIRTDISLILCELEAYRIVIKRLVYAVRKDQQNPGVLGEEKCAKFIQDIKTTLKHKQTLRQRMQKLIENDNICQMTFAKVFCEAPNCMAVSAKWTFEYPDSRNDTSMAYCPDGMINHQSVIGSTEHTAIFTSSMNVSSGQWSIPDSKGTVMWGATQEQGRWTDLKIGLREEGRFITNQYELLIDNKYKVNYRDLCGRIRKNSIDGLIAYLQLKDPREEHIGAGTKFMALHMYAQLCNDLQAKGPYQTPAFLWERMQDAQAQALRKKTHALQHAWYLSKHTDNTRRMKISADEFENLPDVDIENFVRQISKYKASRKETDEVRNNIDATYCLSKYMQHLKEGSSIWDFTEEGYIAAITLSLQSKDEIVRILRFCQRDEQKQALGQILMRLCDQYHVMTRANIERLPELKDQLLAAVDDLKYWPGFGIEPTDKKLEEYAKNKGEQTRDAYCNFFLPIVNTEALRGMLQNMHFPKLYDGIKAYLEVTESGLFVWPMANKNTRKFHDYPSNKSYLELAMQHDIVPLLQLMFRKVVNGILQLQTGSECSDILEKEFMKKNNDYTYPLNLAAYYGSVRAVQYWVSLCENYDATHIIAQKHRYGREELTSLEMAEKRLNDLKSSNAAKDHPADAAQKYAKISQVLQPYRNVRARPRMPRRNTGTTGVSVKARQNAAVRAGTGTTQPGARVAAGARAQPVQPDTRVAAGAPAPVATLKPMYTATEQTPDIVRTDMRLEDDVTLIDPKDGTLLKDKTTLIRQLKDQGINTVEDFMNVTDWQDRKFAWIGKEMLILCKKAQTARQYYAKWFEKQKNNMKFQNQAQQKYYDAFKGFMNPYIIDTKTPFSEETGTATERTPDIVRTVGAGAPGDFAASVLEENFSDLRDFLVRFDIDPAFADFLRWNEDIGSIHELQELVNRDKQKITERVPIGKLTPWKQAIWDELINKNSTVKARGSCLRLFEILTESEIENGNFARIAGRDLIQEMETIMDQFKTKARELQIQFERKLIDQTTKQSEMNKNRDVRFEQFKEVTCFFLNHHQLARDFLRHCGVNDLKLLHELFLRKMHSVKEVAKLGDLSPLQEAIFQDLALAPYSKVSDKDKKNVIKFIQLPVLEALESL